LNATIIQQKVKNTQSRKVKKDLDNRERQPVPRQQVLMEYSRAFPGVIGEGGREEE